MTPDSTGDAWGLRPTQGPHALSYLSIRLLNFGKIIEIVFHSDTDDVYSV